MYEKCALGLVCVCLSRLGADMVTVVSEVEVVDFGRSRRSSERDGRLGPRVPLSFGRSHNVSPALSHHTIPLTVLTARASTGPRNINKSEFNS